jgi:hypothetical protein
MRARAEKGYDPSSPTSVRERAVIGDERSRQQKDDGKAKLYDVCNQGNRDGSRSFSRQSEHVSESDVGALRDAHLVGDEIADRCADEVNALCGQRPVHR